MGSNIHIEKHYNHSMKKVWFALTNRAALEKWFTKHNLHSNLDELEPGDTFTFISTPKRSWDGMMHCEVKEINRPYKLIYTFGGDAFKKKPSVVTWTLIEEESGTTLKLDHSGFEGLQGFFLRFLLQSGWKKALSSDEFIEAMTMS
ncbi:hypothetical protein GLW08_12460 [Pontibacillus yanchengensis]|uniref:Uncharacterized protein n=2 Tax=Pontibacillus yanchengensis TaxID=462910 RepID=A0ACC7VHQ1_9BACI|nr:SRPBCC domain-containing protein [Pontibacillus yanchengensis]MYL33638.1 hypothetical protein [Pontibacillus yanchengensis]MYL54150.1 hypothetical protein [Pontibacillus yanchengensis]